MCVTELLGEILKKQGECFEKEGVGVLSLLCSLTDEKRDRIEMELILEEEGEDSRLLRGEFGVSDHYGHVARHKDALFLVYAQLHKYFEHVSLMDVVCHDWTKFLFSLSVGYTWMWSRKDGLREEWGKVLKTGEDERFFEGWNKIWEAAWRQHYTLEDHHPEYFGTGTAERNVENILRVAKKEDMCASGLEESFLDMASMGLMKMKGVSGTEYVEFETRYLDRYNVGDARKVVEKVLEIRGDGKREMYDEYMGMRTDCPNPGR